MKNWTCLVRSIWSRGEHRILLTSVPDPADREILGITILTCLQGRPWGTSEQHLGGGPVAWLKLGSILQWRWLLLTSAVASWETYTASHHPVGHTALNSVPGVGGHGYTRSMCVLKLLPAGFFVLYKHQWLIHAAHTQKASIPSDFGWRAREERQAGIFFPKIFSSLDRFYKQIWICYVSAGEWREAVQIPSPLLYNEPHKWLCSRRNHSAINKSNEHLDFQG